MTEGRKLFFPRINCNESLALIAERGREALKRRDKLGITFEKLPPGETRSLFEVLHEVFSDGAGI